jgi:hypothetical protein
MPSPAELLAADPESQQKAAQARDEALARLRELRREFEAARRARQQ